MPVLNALSVTLEVPTVEEGLRFYGDAGLDGTREGSNARFRCVGQDRDSIVLLGGAPKKRLHHITLRADGLDEIAMRTPGAGGTVVAAPQGSAATGLWVRDPHGMLIHLVDQPPDPPLAPAPPFEVNGPGYVVRIRRSAILAAAKYPPVRPLRLGHILLFTPDVARSVEFLVDALGMGLADRAQDVIAFCCARKNSDHHVVALAKSPGIGFHHASFQVADPDEVGRGGRALAEKSARGEWGFGRHTVGSNFFHYIKDPWGSWFEYYSDMDFIDDYALWTPTNYELVDSLASWAPALPGDFVLNREVADEDA
ncbi:MAG: VOC family protein [Proteobacteria bacterium]|jgi:catechol 2,3-dioxygenase-like lactoylglutathione lyase family enzyme|nr:VOC family protein [Pseudomonadota bacterium]